MNKIEIVPTSDEHRPVVEKLLVEAWGSAIIVTRGKSVNAADLPGLAAWSNSVVVGLLTYKPNGVRWEIVSLYCRSRGSGVGTALLDAVINLAKRDGCRKLWLITTNDNTPALRFYQRRGFYLKALYPGAVDIDRRIKPEIPLLGVDNIPLRDEIELEMVI